MSGTLRGRVDCLATNNDPVKNCQEVFVNYYLAFEILVAAGLATRIALQYGNGGTGTDYHDGAAPFGSNAFAVFRVHATATQPEVYWHLQWTGAEAIGTGVGAPCEIKGLNTYQRAVGVATATAFEADGITPANPWNGTTNNDGTDLKGTPVWVAPAGGTIMLAPMSNDGGSNSVNKENLIALFSPLGVGDTLDIRQHYVFDDTSGLWIIDYGDSLASECGGKFPLTKLGDLREDPYPYFVFSHVGTPSSTAGYATTIGTSTREGALWHPRLRSSNTFRLDHLNTAVASSGIQPSVVVAPFDKFEELEVYPQCAVTSQFGHVGVGGEEIRVSRGKDQDVSSDRNRIFAGSSSEAACFSFRWFGTDYDNYEARSTSARGGKVYA